VQNIHIKLTGDVEECRRFWRNSEPVGRPTRVPAGVVSLDAVDNEAAVGVDTSSRHQRRRLLHVDAVAVPAVRDVVGKALGLARQLDAAAFERRCVRWWNHDVRVTCTPITAFARQ